MLRQGIVKDSHGQAERNIFCGLTNSGKVCSSDNGGTEHFWLCTIIKNKIKFVFSTTLRKQNQTTHYKKLAVLAYDEFIKTSTALWETIRATQDISDLS